MIRKLNDFFFVMETEEGEPIKSVGSGGSLFYLATFGMVAVSGTLKLITLI